MEFNTYDVTVITCAMKFHEPFLRANYKLLRKFSKDIRWIVINNDDGELDFKSNSKKDSRLEIQKGPTIDLSYG